MHLPGFDPSVATPDVKFVALRDSDGNEGHVVAIVGDAIVGDVIIGDVIVDGRVEVGSCH